MKNMKLVLFTIIEILALSMVSCQKQPVADFSTDKSEYNAGDTVFFTNKSLNAKSVIWTMPDGQTSTNPNLKFYTIYSGLNDGTLNFKLEAYSKNNKKTNEAIKTVKVFALKGTLTVWTSYSSVDTIKVTVDSVSGIVTKYYSSSPDCGAAGCFNLTLTVGTHTIKAIMGGITWPTSTITVSKNNCTKFELQPVSSM
jgi:hypothetical protein